MTLIKAEEVIVNGEETEVNIENAGGDITAVLINQDDLGFCKVRFDERTIEEFCKNLDKVTNPLNRLHVW
jgi:hypothetical protein